MKTKPIIILLICIALAGVAGCKSSSIRQIRNVKVSGNKIAVDAGLNACWSAPVYNKKRDTAYLIKFIKKENDKWFPLSLAKVTANSVIDPIIKNTDTFSGSFMPSVLVGDILAIIEVSDDGNRLRVFVLFKKDIAGDETGCGGCQFFLDVQTKHLSSSFDKDINK